VTQAKAELEAARTDDRLAPSAKANCTKALPRLDRVLWVLDLDNPLVFMVDESCRAVSWELRFLARPKPKSVEEPVRLEHVMALRDALRNLRVGDLVALLPLSGEKKE
jgi:hypothetical protein